VIVPTRAVQDSLVLRGAIAPEEIHVVPPAVDAGRYPAPDPPFTGEKRIVGALCALERGAGLEILIEAVRRLAEVHLLLAGEGPEDLRLRRYARERGVARHVTVSPVPAQWESIVRLMDVVVFPGSEDGYAAGILQAMAAARPVVASGVGSAFSWVREGVTGLLAPKGRADDLSERISWLLDRPMRATEMGASGRRAVLDGHDPDQAAERTEQLLRGALAGGASA
jgi:glycosyltransferase involved in cell wall biosynthesis